LASCVEHQRLTDLLERGDVASAAEYLQQVHWSFEVQHPYINRYYAELEP